MTTHVMTTHVTKEQLIVDNMPLAYYVVNKLFENAPRGALYDDCIGVALEHLCIAAGSYDADKGTTFASWAYRHIHFAVRRQLREDRLHGLTGVGGNMPATAMPRVFQNAYAVNEKQIDAADPTAERVETRMQLETLKKKLRPHEFALAQMLGGGVSYEILSYWFGKSADSLRKDMSRLRSKLAYAS